MCVDKAEKSVVTPIPAKDTFEDIVVSSASMFSSSECHDCCLGEDFIPRKSDASCA